MDFTQFGSFQAYLAQFASSGSASGGFDPHAAKKRESFSAETGDIALRNTSAKKRKALPATELQPRRPRRGRVCDVYLILR